MLAGWIGKSLDVVEVLVIELIEQGLESCLDFREIHEPAGVRVDFAADGDLDSKRVAVHACAFVTRRYIGQAVRRFEGERLEDLHSASLAPQGSPESRKKRSTR